MEKIILIGGGGHCKVVIEAILLQKQYKIVGIIDIKHKVGESILGVPVIGCDEDIKNYRKNGIRNCFITAGSTGFPDLRLKIFKVLKGLSFNLPMVIHPAACVSKFAKLGKGCYIAAGTVINSGAQLGENCIINTSAIVDHDCQIGNFVHIASGVTLSGGICIGENTHVGTGASVAHYINIGANSIVGAGSVVVDDIPIGVVAYGNPCRKIRKNA